MIKTIHLVCFALCYAILSLSPSAAQDDRLTHAQWYAVHPEYREAIIRDRFFKHSDIQNLLEQYGASPVLDLSIAGRSIEGREIYHIRVGDGPIDVLLWSQMHGDEPTATMAIMDLLRFFSEKDDFTHWKDEILSELTLHFIPMLNPDGAEQFSRFNALGIDLNRDALRLQSPESKILKEIRDDTEAEFGFNLHDQSKYYSAGHAPYTASVSFLAPAFNYEKDIDSIRARSMRLIAVLDDMLQHYIPNRVAKFSDDFEPRAFGDNIQKWGTSTVLIESGGLPGDSEKQELRRLHFALLLHAFEAIADHSYEYRSLREYEEIPVNARYYHDLVLRKVLLHRDGESYTLDLAFRSKPHISKETGDVYYTASLTDIGDLSTYFGYETLEENGYEILQAGLSSKRPQNLNSLSQKIYLNEISSGQPVFEMDNLPPRSATYDLPCVLTRDAEGVDFSIFRGGNPVFYLGKNGKRTHLVTNGLLYPLDQLEQYFNSGR